MRFLFLRNDPFDTQDNRIRRYYFMEDDFLGYNTKSVRYGEFAFGCCMDATNSSNVSVTFKTCTKNNNLKLKNR